jgi:uncharacterized protein
MIELKERPKNPIIIEGFPGFGFVSTIATEFLIKHLNAKRIGKFCTPKLTPLAAIRNSEIIDPLEIYYAKKENIVILRALTNVSGAEWEIAGTITELAKTLKAREIISIEGIGTEKPEKTKEPKAYYFTNVKKSKFGKSSIENLKNGIVVGVTGVLLLKADEIPLSCIFVEANPALPDSRAAGEVIKVLDNYLDLKIDYKPLMKTAEEFENKLKELVSKVKKTSEQKQEKDTSYLG